MRFDEVYKRKVDLQLTDLIAYLVELKSTLNPHFPDQEKEYKQVLLVKYLAGELRQTLRDLPKADYSFIDEYFDEKKKGGKDGKN